ncbi:TIGR01440 family protein [Lentilactobacillus raoultii]|uniref:UPF0340 protein ACFQ22_11940 n=1 Tax=Lentilactobacillus raoultii TaxID=1987503 RepID=A0ABW3PR71_9LACO|nr:TIGR01440 family protein [Lentilactobacillus raoultii]
MHIELTKNLKIIQENTENVLTDYFDIVKFPQNSIFVLGCSTSEVSGEWMGTHPSLNIGRIIIETLENFLMPRHINLAVQGCQHINRALLVERTVAENNNLEVVSVVPAMHAGGGAQVVAYKKMSDPVEVEHVSAFGGMDIGGTEIGMHVKFVQIPVQTTHHHIGAANVVSLYSRPKLIGGPRAMYQFTEDNTVN